MSALTVLNADREMVGIAPETASVRVCTWEPPVAPVMEVRGQLFVPIISRRLGHDARCWIGCDKGRYRQHPRRQRLVLFRLCRSRPKFPDDHSPHLEASVCFRCTVPLFAQRRGRGETESVPVASTTMTQAGASAPKVVRCQIGYASLAGAPLHRVPNYVGCHASFLSHSPLQHSPEYFSLAHSRMSEPSIEKLLAPRRYRYRS
jgi:hypothetical protein